MRKKHVIPEAPIYIGVNWNTEIGKWQATIWLNKEQRLYLVGYYTDQKVAKKFRDKAIKQFIAEGRYVGHKTRISPEKYNLIKEYFYSHQRNSSTIIAHKFGISTSTALFTLDKILKEKPPVKSKPTVKISAWRKQENKKVIKALKAYNESVPDEDKVTIYGKTE